MRRSNMWPARWVGEHKCCFKLNESMRARKSCEELSRLLSTRRLKSPVIRRLDESVTWERHETCSTCCYGNTEKLRDIAKHITTLVRSKGVAMVRALVSKQCGPGSSPGADAICGLSLLLVLSFAPRGFSPSTLVSPIFKNQPTRDQVDEEPLSGCAISKSLFIYFTFSDITGCVFSERYI